MLHAEALRLFAPIRMKAAAVFYCEDGMPSNNSSTTRGAVAADFEFIIVYDVSRWGRFQDPDESAYYEFICKQAGIQVLYCAELFENDGSLASTLLKHFRRGMAGDFSRDLSVKVFAGQAGWRHGLLDGRQSPDTDCVA